MEKILHSTLYSNNKLYESHIKTDAANIEGCLVQVIEVDGNVVVWEVQKTQMHKDKIITFLQHGHGMVSYVQY